ncbi:hypothetical protein TgHK011_002931 [Trichoderma gracile]|nr:hypothetical protein TgHK011_002931 [Trichoderma gracile]
MCGRYSLALPPSLIRQMLEDDGIQITDAPDDQGPEAPYQTYNFSPGSHGIVCVADSLDHGVGCKKSQDPVGESSLHETARVEEVGVGAAKYRLRTMKWGIVPSWSRKKGASVPKAINCRDDSLRTHGGMWQGMKDRKRCVVVAQGFFEWLNVSTKEKVPHFVKRRDGRLMCFAGLWDSAGNEDTENKTYTYAIITTNSNQQLRFLHHRMPVILDADSKDFQEWLHPRQRRWTNDLQSLLKPYQGDLDIYPVIKDVGKVGRSSPSFIKPLNAQGKEHDIARFFKNDGQPPDTEKKPETSVKGEKDESRDNKPTSQSDARPDLADSWSGKRVPVATDSSLVLDLMPDLPALRR